MQLFSGLRALEIKGCPITSCPQADCSLAGGEQGSGRLDLLREMALESSSFFFTIQPLIYQRQKADPDDV